LQRVFWEITMSIDDV
jgi:hypothetical protein